jgi:RNA polymerase sigma-70 factor (ECF subfamily)
MAPSSAEAAGTDQAVDWQEQLGRHRNWLRTVILARAGEVQAVDEIMQEVAVAAVEQRSPLSDPTKTAPWLYQLAVRQSLMYRRKQGRRRNLERQYAERVARRSQSSSDADPLGWLLADERRQLIRAAVKRLHPRDAELLLLKYTENWDYHQIADHLGISHSAVQSRLHRARERFREELAAANVVEAQT